MMKCVFALIALLHLCYSVKSNMDVNREIINKLKELNESYRGKKGSITLPDVIRVPSQEMINEHWTSCMGVFVRELKQILNNVTVVGDSEHILTELRANLGILGTHVENDQVCNMTERTGSLMPFRPYAEFLRKLNRSKKR